jgi:ParB/RepB/Spo0J family partition protein
MHTTLIPLSQLFVSELNVRKSLDSGQEDSNIDELAESIREKGLLSPLTVRPWPDGRFEILVGQRRYLACRRIQLDPVPCLVREGLSDSDAVSLSLIENVHRADMHPIDKAKAFQILFTKYGSAEEVTKESACSVTTVRKYLKLLELPLVLQERIGTADGPSGISALSRLASTFKGDEALTAYNEISGFTQRVQEEILKRSDGDLERLNELVEEAQEGVFDIRRCGAAHGCQLIHDILEGRLSEEEFGAMVKGAAVDGVEPHAARVQEAAISFWQSLARKTP